MQDIHDVERLFLQDSEEKVFIGEGGFHVKAVMTVMVNVWVQKRLKARSRRTSGS
jgi:hypothetical protein